MSMARKMGRTDRWYAKKGLAPVISSKIRDRRWKFLDGYWGVLLILVVLFLLAGGISLLQVKFFGRDVLPDFWHIPWKVMPR